MLLWARQRRWCSSCKQSSILPAYLFCCRDKNRGAGRSTIARCGIDTKLLSDNRTGGDEHNTQYSLSSEVSKDAAGLHRGTTDLEDCKAFNAIEIRISFPRRLHGADCGQQSGKGKTPEDDACDELSSPEEDFSSAAVLDWQHLMHESWGPSKGDPDSCFKVSKAGPHAVKMRVGVPFLKVDLSSLPCLGFKLQDLSKEF